MKHIKTYKIFESVSKVEIDDILDTLVDDGFEVVSILSHKYIEIEISRVPIAKYVDIKNTINHLISYLKDHNYWLEGGEFYENGKWSSIRLINDNSVLFQYIIRFNGN